MVTAPEGGMSNGPPRRPSRLPGTALACALLAAMLLLPAVLLWQAPGGTGPGGSALLPGPDRPSTETPSGQAAPAWKNYPSTAGPFTFPDDEGFHPPALEEWWYVNGHLLSAEGNRYDFMVCFYKHGIVAASLLDVSSGVYLNHSETFLDIQRETGRLGLRFGPNELFQIDGRPFTYQLSFRNHDFSINLTLESRRAPLVPNGDGVISMGRGPSYYYSLTDLSATGTVRLGSSGREVTGSAWMDRQWGFWSPTLDWDWYSIKLDDGTQVLAYRIYEGGAESPSSLFVSAIDALGKSGSFEQSGDWYRVVLLYKGYWRSPDTGKLYSSGWELTVPGLDLSLSITPVAAAQETLFPADTTPVSRAKPFWEGACVVSGVHDGRPVSGRAFVESTLDYGSARGDLVITPKEYFQDGDSGRLVVKVENLGGSSLDNVEVRLVRGSPFEGGKVLATYRLDDRHNSTYLSESLPNIGDSPLYIMVDPDNHLPEGNEGNNIAVALPK